MRYYNYGATSISSGTSAATGSYRVITPSVAGSTVAAATGAIALAADSEVRNSGSLTLGGVISGDAGITKTGAGTLTLSGANTFNGTTTVSAGTLVLSNTLALQNSTLASGATFSSTVSGGTFTLGGLSGSSAIALTNNAVTPAAIVLTVGNNGLGTTYSGVLSGSGGLIKTGVGVLKLSGANTYSGNTEIGGGSVRLASQFALQNSTLVTSNSGGMLTFDTGTAYTVGGLSGNGSIALANNAATPAAVALSVGNSSRDTGFSGSLTGAGSIVKIGTGTLALSGPNGYTGGTSISSGTLAFQRMQAVPSTGAINVGAGAVVALGVGGSGQFTATTAETFRTGRATFAANSAFGLDTGLATTDVSYPSAIGDTSNGALGLVKLGANTLVLTGVNTYSGRTTVVAGRLLANTVQGDGSATGSGPVSVNGGQLAGTGGTAGAVTVNTGGIVSAGAGATIASTGMSATEATSDIGKLTTASQSWKVGGRAITKVSTNSTAAGAGTAYDTQSITGTLDLISLAGGKFTLTLAKTSDGTFDTTVSSLYTIAHAVSIIGKNGVSGATFGDGDDVTSLFTLDTTNLALPGEGAFSVFVASGSGGNGFDMNVEYDPAPEPTTAALVGLSALPLLGRRRRVANQLN